MWLGAAVAAVGLSGLLGYWLLETGPADLQTPQNGSSASTSVLPVRPSIQSAGNRTPSPADVPLPPEPEDSPLAIYDDDCLAHFGRGPAMGAAAVALPSETGVTGEATSLVALVDRAGEQFRDTVHFRAHRIRIGRQPDGTLVAAFGNPRLNSREFRSPYSVEPLHVYVDGELLYRSYKASTFDVAPDGSSFFVREPLSGGASQLIIHDLLGGAERYVDLDVDFRADNEYEPGFGVSYADGGREIVFYPAYADAFGRGRHRFYSVATDDVREIDVGGAGERDAHSRATATGNAVERVTLPRQYAVFASSTAGYFAEPLEPGNGGWRQWRVVGRQFEFGSAPSASLRWSREIDLRHFAGHMFLGGDGRWLAIRSWNFQVLDTRTGATVFEYPRAGDKGAERARLASVLPANATLRGVGAVTSERFEGDALVLRRRIGSSSPCHGRDPGDYNDCLADLRRRGAYRTVMDVFDMNNVQVDSQPDYRLALNPTAPCQRPMAGGGRLVVEEGELALAQSS